jgi:hypothetical protein
MVPIPSPVIYPIVSNNFIKVGSGTGAAYALYASYSHARYYHNTFNVTSGSTTTPAVYLQYGCCYSPLQDFKYNIVANSGNGTSAGLCIFILMSIPQLNVKDRLATSITREQER